MGFVFVPTSYGHRYWGLLSDYWERFELHYLVSDLLTGEWLSISEQNGRFAQQTKLPRSLHQFFEFFDRARENQKKAPDEIRAYVAGIRMYARPDTGCAHNLVPLSLFNSSGLATAADISLDKSNTVALEIANGQVIKTLGSFKAPIRLKGGVVEHKATWHVFKGSDDSVRLSGGFLKSVDFFAKFAHRMIARNQSQMQLGLAGNQTERLIGQLDGELIATLPDTGADANFVTSRYCKARGWEVNKAEHHQRWFRLPNGALVQAVGAVMQRKWTFPQQENQELMLDFYVLAGCRRDVILGRRFLFDQAVFTRQSTWVIDLQDWQGHDAIPQINWLDGGSGNSADDLYGIKSVSLAQLFGRRVQKLARYDLESSDPATVHEVARQEQNAKRKAVGEYLTQSMARNNVVNSAGRGSRIEQPGSAEPSGTGGDEEDGSSATQLGEAQA